MDGKQVEQRLQALVGTGAKGWQSQAADLLDVSQRTIARNIATPTHEFLKRLAQYDTEFGMMPLDAMAAGARDWIIGHSAAEVDTTDIFLTHLPKPTFFVRASRSIDDVGLYVTWLDAPTPDQSRELLAEAKKIVMDFIDNPDRTMDADDIAKAVIASGKPANQSAPILKLIAESRTEKLAEVMRMLKLYKYNPPPR